MARRRVHAAVFPDGRWSVRDEHLGYRICNHHQSTKFPGSPSHIHDAQGTVIAACTIASVREAEQVMDRYRRHHTAFDLEAFRQEIDHGHPHHP